MYKITFKGKDSDPIYIPDEVGKKVLDGYMNRSIKGQIIMVGDHAFSADTIKGMYHESVDSGEKDRSHASEVATEYHRGREEDLKLSVEEKANKVEFFKLFHLGMVGDKPSSETVKKAIDIQREFFRNNPRRLITDPTLFREIVVSKELEGTHITNLMKKSVQGICERAWMEDKNHDQIIERLKSGASN